MKAEGFARIGKTSEVPDNQIRMKAVMNQLPNLHAACQTRHSPVSEILADADAGSGSCRSLGATFCTTACAAIGYRTAVSDSILVKK